MRRLLCPVLIALSVLLFASPAAAGCIERHSVPIASGSSPSGLPWKVEATIGNNGDCREWLFGMDFEVPGIGYWGWATGIPAGGHLPETFMISASDRLQEDGSWRAFMGTVGGKVTRLVARLSSGKRIAIRPRLVPAQLRTHIAWLENTRYFIQYYPPTGFVTSISLFSASGRLLYRASNSADGEF